MLAPDVGNRFAAFDGDRRCLKQTVEQEVASRHRQRRYQIRVRVDADRLEGRQAGDDEEDGASRKRRQRRLRNVEQGAVEPPVAMIEGRPEPVNRNHQRRRPGTIQNQRREEEHLRHRHRRRTPGHLDRKPSRRQEQGRQDDHPPVEGDASDCVNGQTEGGGATHRDHQDKRPHAQLAAACDFVRRQHVPVLDPSCAAVGRHLIARREQCACGPSTLSRESTTSRGRARHRGTETPPEAALRRSRQVVAAPGCRDGRPQQSRASRRSTPNSRNPKPRRSRAASWNMPVPQNAFPTTKPHSAVWNPGSIGHICTIPTGFGVPAGTRPNVRCPRDRRSSCDQRMKRRNSAVVRGAPDTNSRTAGSPRCAISDAASRWRNSLRTTVSPCSVGRRLPRARASPTARDTSLLSLLSARSARLNALRSTASAARCGLT